MLKKRIALIPRYNWDYGIVELATGLSALPKSNLKTDGNFANVFGQNPIFTASGRSSLYAILKSLNLSEGSCVGVPLFCCSVVFDAIIQAKLTPKFIDINLEDFNLSSADLQKKIDFLSAVVVVHMFGHPADMDSIYAVCKDKIPIIEDCAQSLFSTYKGKNTGFLSTVSFFSFRSGKYISAGEGSAIFCHDSSLHDSIKSVVDTFEKPNLLNEVLHCIATYIKSILYHRPLYGTFGYPVGKFFDKKLNLTAKSGFKLYRISKSDLQIVKKRIGIFRSKIEKQRQNATYLLENLKVRHAFLPVENKESQNNYFQFALRFQTVKQRDFVADYLLRHGIDSAKYLDDILNISKKLYGYPGDCLNAELCSKTTLIIPHYYTLSPYDLQYIRQTLNEADELLAEKQI
jgi:perosamine synthetase